MPQKAVAYLSVAERRARGRLAAERTPPGSHRGWACGTDRRDPIALLEEQDVSREPDLVPVRHGRMKASPFSFYRGAAKIMASDLRCMPVAGLIVQLCGDAHLSNFGAFASPEGRLVFDLNDFDETLPGPFEYDVMRMAASFAIAARSNGFSNSDAETVTLASARAYREGIAGFADMRTIEIWHAHLSAEEIATSALGSAKTRQQTAELKRAQKNLARARTRDAQHALSKLGELVDGRYRIVSRPPVVVPLREMVPSDRMSSVPLETELRNLFWAYRATLPDDRRQLLDRFQVVDAARQVAGVGSVGRRGFIVLLQGRDPEDPLFLQVKEATPSVLEDHLPRSRYQQPGRRVVEGQRLMQAASDIYLGWTRGVQAGRHHYWRQLREMKGSAHIGAMTPASLEFYAGICGWTLARAHARSGDPVAIDGYLGPGDDFDQSVASFSRRYGDQNERDYRRLVRDIDSGRLQALEGV